MRASVEHQSHDTTVDIGPIHFTLDPSSTTIIAVDKEDPIDVGRVELRYLYPEENDPSKTL